MFVKFTLLGCVKPMLECILIALRRAGPRSTTVHPAALLTGHGRCLAGRSPAGLRTAARCTAHGLNIALMRARHLQSLSLRTDSGTDSGIGSASRSSMSF